MTANGWVQIAIYAAILLALARPLGGYMTAVFDGRVAFLRPLERAIYALAASMSAQEQHWLTYGFGMLLFHAAGFALLYAMHAAAILSAVQPAGAGRRLARSRFQHRRQLRRPTRIGSPTRPNRR